MQLDELAQQYRKRYRRLPVSTRELLDAGLLNGIPVDPDGFAYVFGPDGKSHPDPASSFVIPPEPSLPAAPK